MSARNFGMTRPAATTGDSSAAGLSRRSRNTGAELPPLPRNSICSDRLTDTDRSRITGRLVVALLSLWFIIPMILAGIMMHFR